VGQRIRSHREASGLSLRELARRLGISPSAISQIETGKSRPSVSTLYAIVSELGMSLDGLFGDGRSTAARQPARAKPASTPRARPATPQLHAQRLIQRATSRTGISLESGVRWDRLTAHADPDADFLYVVYDVGGSSSRGARFIRHSGREYGLVLSGTLEVTVGDETHRLGPGDSICFESTAPHLLRNIGSEPVHGIWFVVGRQIDRSVAVLEAGEREGPPV
jgi:transcriptional regulator with XRE-family HTH domain